MQLLFKFKSLQLKPKPKIKLNYFYLNSSTYINHSTQLGIININLKCQNKNIYKKIYKFQHCLKSFLGPLNIFLPNSEILFYLWLFNLKSQCSTILLWTLLLFYIYLHSILTKYFQCHYILLTPIGENGCQMFLEFIFKKIFN
jgi:hypothetical protein